MPKCFTIGISGPSGSGKSTLARRLARTLQGTVVSTDNYFHLNPPLKKYRSKGKNWELPENVDWSALAKVLRSLRLGKVANGRKMYWETETWEPVEIRPARFIIVEGFLLLHDSTIRRLLDVCVYLDVSDELGISRRMRREKSTKNEKWFREVTFPEYAHRRKAFERRATKVLDASRSPTALEAEVLAMIDARRKATK